MNFTKRDFIFQVPSLKKFLELEQGEYLYNEYFAIADEEIKPSFFKAKYKTAMSWLIAHYIFLWIHDNEKSFSLFDQTREVLAGLKQNDDYTKVMVIDDSAKFYHQTPHGQKFYNLRRQVNGAKATITYRI